MTLQQLINRVTRTLPQATGSTIAQQSIIDELNHGVDEINLLAKCLIKTVKVSLPASSSWTEFSLSQLFSGYLGIDKTGVWFFDANGKSYYLYAKTKRWLDINIRNWRDTTGGNIPTWVYIRNDALGFYPYVNVSGCSISADCIVKAPPMTNTANYPWSNSTSEITTLRPFDNAICAYAIWKLAPAVFDKEGRNQGEQEFTSEIKKAMSQINNRQDMTSDVDYYIRTDGMGGSFLPR